MAIVGKGTNQLEDGSVWATSGTGIQERELWVPSLKKPLAALMRTILPPPTAVSQLPNGELQLASRSRRSILTANGYGAAAILANRRQP